MRRYGIALAMAAMLMPFASLAQSDRAPASQASVAATEPGDGDTGANATHAQRSLMGLVMGALIESAEQTARLERQAQEKQRTGAPRAADRPHSGADRAGAAERAPMPPSRTSTMQQVAIGLEP